MPTIEQARSWYPPGDPVHGFDHVMRVYRMAETIAGAEGADLEIVRAAALLHDVAGSAPGSDGHERGRHHEISASFARRILLAEGWEEDRIAAVQHCIRAHRFRQPSEMPRTMEAKVLFDADKLDVLGAIGVARTIAYAVLDHQPIYTEPSQSFLQTREKEPGEPHSSYHEFLFKLRNVKDQLYTRTGRDLAAARHEFLTGFYSRLRDEIAGIV